MVSKEARANSPEATTKKRAYLDIEREVEDGGYSRQLIEFCSYQQPARQPRKSDEVGPNRGGLTLSTLVHTREDERLAALTAHVVDERDEPFPLGDISRPDSAREGRRSISTKDKEDDDRGLVRRTHLNRASLMSNVPTAPRSTAIATWSGPYHARSSSVPSILWNLSRATQRKKTVSLVNNGHGKKQRTDLSSIIPSLAYFVPESRVVT